VDEGVAMNVPTFGVEFKAQVSVTSYSRGNKVYYDGEVWRYMDGAPDDDSRPCPRCGQHPTPEGHDACLGTLPGVKAACCGHGVEDPYVMEAGE
jgi:hypothetical protein